MGKAAGKGSRERTLPERGGDVTARDLVPPPLGGNTVQEETLRTNGEWSGHWEGVPFGGGALRSTATERGHCSSRSRHGLGTNAGWLEGNTA